MQITLDSFDVLNAAIMLEDRGSRFYADAALLCENSQKKLLLRLAEMEQGHALTFRNLLLKLEKSSSGLRKSEIDSESRDYLEALTSDRIITKECRIDKADDYGQILARAILIEKNSVFFYTAVRDSLLQKMTAETIDHLIAEEIVHFQMLSNALGEWNKRQQKS